MQKITLVCVGRLKEKFYTDAAAEYEKRLSRYCRIQTVEIPETRLPDAPSPAQIQTALQKEFLLIQAKIPPGAYVSALCIEGALCSSEELACRMRELAAQPLVFLLGGSRGLHADAKALAQWRLSMSPMTFPHHLARVMLLEQLYRACQINAGGRYHK